MTKQVYNNLIKPIEIKNIIIPHKIFIMIMIIIIIIIIVIIIFIIIIIVIIIVTIKGTHYKMETIFMNTKNSKKNEPHRFRLDLTDKLSLKNPKKKTWL